MRRHNFHGEKDSTTLTSKKLIPPIELQAESRSCLIPSSKVGISCSDLSAVLHTPVTTTRDLPVRSASAGLGCDPSASSLLFLENAGICPPRETCESGGCKGRGSGRSCVFFCWSKAAMIDREMAQQVSTVTVSSRRLSMSDSG